jgi:SET domain-containing protein
MPAHHTTLHFEIRSSTIQGRGAFALRTIRKGARIVEYTGERIDEDEADRRYARRKRTYLFALESGLVIDALSGGNDARFINHSCEPNCQAVEEEGRIFIHALRTIREGEELVYDYAFVRGEDVDPEEEAKHACRCGADACRGTMYAPAKRARSSRR